MFSSPTGKARLRELLHSPEEGVTPRIPLQQSVRLKERAQASS